MRKTIVLGVLVAGLCGGDASAGQYDVHSCRLPDGTPIAAVGWLGSFGGGDWLAADDTCSRGGALTARLMGVPTYAHPQTAFSRWRFEAPTDTAIRRVRGHFAFSTAPGEAYASPLVEAEADEGQGRFGVGPGASSGSSAAWNAFGNERDTQAFTRSRGFQIAVRCLGGGGPCPYQGRDTARAEIFRAQTTLEDLTDPRVIRTSGRLLDPGVHRGLEQMHLEASDSGSGVYRLVVELDGVEALGQVIDPNAGQCADASPGDQSRDFTVPVPCKLEVNGGETLDTRLLPDGEHRLRVIVEDAAGNRRVAAGPLEGWRVSNAPAPAPAVGGPVLPAAGLTPSGVMSPTGGAQPAVRARLELFFVARGSRRVCRPAVDLDGRTLRKCRRVSDGLSTRRDAALAVAYPRGVRLAGRLMTLDGRPIGGARLHLRRRRLGRRRPFERFSARTRADGRFRARLGRSPSERIRVAYYPSSASRPVLSRELVRITPAPVTVRVTRRRLRPGGRLVLHGRLDGANRPRGGVVVVAEVRLRGHWIEFAERRVGASPHFSASGRFGVPGRYAVRVRVLPAPGYPFRASVSRSVRVTVR